MCNLGSGEKYISQGFGADISLIHRKVHSFGAISFKVCS